MAKQEILAGLIAHFSYLGVFLFVALSGFIIPLPEEVTLLLVGYLSATGLLNSYLALAVCIIGILAGDNLLFFLSRKSKLKIIKKLNSKVKKKFSRHYLIILNRNIGKAVFLMRFMVGLRFFGPLLAGQSKAKWSVFQFYNLLAALIYVPLIFFLGYHFHSKLTLIVTEVEFARHLISILSLTFFGFIIVYLFRKRYE
jgi:membrane protein DedA with SNARE-associated domain